MSINEASKNPKWNLEFMELSDRAMLYFISKFSMGIDGNYLYEMIMERNKNPSLPETRKELVTKRLALLRTKGFVKEIFVKDRTKLKYKITLKGQIYRLYTHPGLPFWSLLIGTIVGLGIIKLSCNAPKNSTKSETIPQTQQLDSSLDKIDSSGRGSLDSNQKPQQ
jgi:hypothetical protein